MSKVSTILDDVVNKIPDMFDQSTIRALFEFLKKSYKEG